MFIILIKGFYIIDHHVCSEQLSTFLLYMYMHVVRERGWSSAGVSTVGSRIDEYGNNVVDCQSYHLTPFAVLVDVSGSIQV